MALRKWTVCKIGDDGFWWVVSPSGKLYSRYLFWFDAFACAYAAATGFLR
jgi:hypothetical protein